MLNPETITGTVIITLNIIAAYKAAPKTKQSPYFKGVIIINTFVGIVLIFAGMYYN